MNTESEQRDTGLMTVTVHVAVPFDDTRARHREVRLMHKYGTLEECKKALRSFIKHNGHWIKTVPVTASWQPQSIGLLDVIAGTSSF